MCPSGKFVKPHTKNPSQKNFCLTYCNIWSVTFEHLSEKDTFTPQAVNTLLERKLVLKRFVKFLPVSHKTDRVGLHQYGGLQSKLLFLLDVVSHVAELLLHHAYRLEVCRMVEGVTSQQEQLWQKTKYIYHMLRNISHGFYHLKCADLYSKATYIIHLMSNMQNMDKAHTRNISSITANLTS